MELCKKLNVDNYWAVQTWYKNRRAKWLMENSIVTRNARHNMFDSSRQSSLATENKQSFLIIFNFREPELTELSRSN